MESILIVTQPFFVWLMQTTLIGSMVICLILVAQKTLGGKLGPRWCHALWLVLLVRLLLPWAPSSRISLGNLIPTWDQPIQSQQRSETTPPPRGNRSVRATEDPVAMPVQGQDRTVAVTRQATPTVGMPVTIRNEPKPRFASLGHALPIVWFVGAILVGVYILMSNFALWWLVKGEPPLVDQTTLELFERCKAQMNVQSLVVLIPSNQIKSPALFGFIRPRLLLPAEMIEKATREEMRYVFLHELAHLKRYDIYLGWLTSLLQIVHWFNPLVWLAFYRMRTDRELACDALVLTTMGQEKSQEYGGAIVGLLRRFSRSRSLPAMAGILENRAQLKRRMTMIAQFNDKSYRWSPLAVVLIIALSFVSLPNAELAGQSQALASEPTNQPKFTKIHIPNAIRGNAELSPDGKKIVLGDAPNKKAWIIPTVGKLKPDYAGEPKSLNTGGIPVQPTGFAWSGDGKWIAFNGGKTIREEGRKGNQKIYIVSAQGGEPREVHENNRHVLNVNYQMSLSPDAKTLAFSSWDANEVHIQTLPVQGGLPKKLVDAQAREPVFSPDGKMIAYVEAKWRRPGTGGLWTVPTDGGTPTHVTDAEDASDPKWSPDGGMIAFIDSGQIYIVPVGDDGKPVGEKFKINLPEGIRSARVLAGWTPDNKIGVLFRKKTESALYSQPVQGGKATFVTVGGTPQQPRWSPDGKRVYHTNRKDESSGNWAGLAIAHVPAEGGDVTTVPLKSEYEIRIGGYEAGNHVSPGGTTLVFAGHKVQKEGGISCIWTLPTEGGEPKQLTHPPVSFVDAYPCWSHDGKAVAFVREETSKNWVKDRWDAHIYVIPANGGEARQLTTDSDRVFSGTTIAWSPDGKLLAYFSRDEGGAPDGTLKVIPVEGGTPRVVTKARSIYANKELAWSPDSKQIAFNAFNPPEGRLIRIVSLENGDTMDVKVDLVDTKIYHLDWSPSGDRLVFAGMRGGGLEFWMIEDFLPRTLPASKAKLSTTLRKITDTHARGFDQWYGPPSSDGRFMSFAAGDLMVRDLATGQVRPLTDKARGFTVKGGLSHALESVISPDSRRVACAWTDYTPSAESGAKGFVNSLYTVEMDGSNDRLVHQGRYIRPKDWSRNGKRILGFQSLDNGSEKPYQVIWVSTVDGTLEVITHLKYQPTELKLSRDGRYVAYDQVQGKNVTQRDVFVFDLEQGREIPVVNSDADDRLLGWTPDGQSLFFASDRLGSWDGWLQPVTQGEAQGMPRVIKRGLGQAQPVGFARNGAYYFWLTDVRHSAFVTGIDLTTGKILSEPKVIGQSGREGCATWSPDGRFLAYCTWPASGTQQTIHIRSLQDNSEITFTPDLPSFTHLTWCPDSRALLISGIATGPSYPIYRLDVQTGEHTVFASTDYRIRKAELSPDGKTLFYDKRAEGERVMMRDIHTGRETELYKGFCHWDLFPDGKSIAFFSRLLDEKQSTVGTIALETGEMTVKGRRTLNPVPSKHL